MAHDIFLIAPGLAEPRDFLPRLMATLSTAPISALLLPIGARDDTAYATFVKAIAPAAQQKGCAVLLDNRPALVRELGVDGVHITAGIKTLREAIAELKPDYIVGTGDIGSRHEAMTRGELGIDYLMFGDRIDADPDSANMANWWAETFEVPSVYLALGPSDPAIDAAKSEFIGLADAIWADPAPLTRFSGIPA